MDDCNVSRHFFVCEGPLMALPPPLASVHTRLCRLAAY